MEINVQSKLAGGRRKAPAPTPQSSAEHLRLERVYGSGSCAVGTVSCQHPIVPGLLAYSSGSVVVLYDSVHKQQTAFFTPRIRRAAGAGKPYACLSFSRDGAYLAAGERGDQSPELLVWEVSSSRCLQALRGHKHGVSSVSFSHDGRLLVSTGESYDGQLCVWDWQAGTLLVKQHTQGDVARACILEEGAAGGTIATVGKSAHFKVWTLALPTGRTGSGSLTSRPVNLKEYRTSSFVGVVAAQGAPPLLYALTSSGVLLSVTVRASSRSLDKSVNLQVPAAFALAASPKLIACACAAGVVRLFEARSLVFKGNLPRHSARSGGAHAGADGVFGGGAAAAGGPGTAATTGALFPNALGAAFDCSGERLTVAYSDRSILIWDVRNPAKVVRARSVLSHAGIVWGAALVPAWQAALLGASASAPTPGGGSDMGPAPGPSSVLCTCGADGTVRLWNVCMDNTASTAGPTGVPTDISAAAKVTRTLRAIIHVTGPAEAAMAAVGPRRFAPDAALPGPGASAAGPEVKPVTLRCLAVSPCGRHLATGDSRGNLRVFSLATLQLLFLREAHDAEILSLDYSLPSLGDTCYLASASRDALVHVYDMARGYELAGTCDAHSGPVTAVRFSSSGSRLALLSCSADKSVVFRHVQLGPVGLSFEVYHTERMSRGVLYGLAVDPAGGRAVAVGQDGQIRLFDVATGRAIRNFAADPVSGDAVSVQVDPTGSFAVCSCADGTVLVYDLEAGSLLARGSGHSEVCTGAALLEDHRGLVTVGGDGCALLWRLPPALTRRAQEAAALRQRQLEAQMAAQAAAARPREEQERQRHEATPAQPRRNAWGTCNAAEGDAVHVDLSVTIMRLRENKPLLSIDKLPPWARKLYGHAEDTTGDQSAAPAAAPQPAGKWALRMAPPAPDATAALAMAATAGAVAVPAPSLPPPQALGGSGVEPREWAVVVEEDDEILYCDPDDEEGCNLALPGGGAGDFAVQSDNTEAGAVGGPEPAATDVDADAEPRSPIQTGGPGCSGGNGNGEQGDAEEQAPKEPASGCGSNCLGGSGLEAAAEAGDGVRDVVRRDLFKEHFDSLGLDQGSATKAPAPDPRRQSLSLLYRQARAAGSSAASAAAVAPPAAAAAAAAPSPPRLAGALPAGGVVLVAGGTPLLARVPPPPTINVARGTTAMEVEADGAVTSAAWTPERAMLPLTSPALANTDKQLRELERIKERLASNMRRRPTAAEPGQSQALANDAGPSAAPANGIASAVGTVGVPAAASGTGVVPIEPVPVSAVVPVVAVKPKQRPQAASAAPVAVVAVSGQAEAQPREVPTSSGITFAPPQPAAPAAPATLPGAVAAGPAGAPLQPTMQPPLPAAAAAVPQPSPGFSTLSACTPWLGRQPGPVSADLSATPAGPYLQAGSGPGASGNAGPADGLLMYNPMYGATPGTPVLGLAVARPPGAGADAPTAASGGAESGPAGASRQSSGVGVRAADGVIDTVLRQQSEGAQDTAAVCIVRRDSGGEAAASKAQSQVEPVASAAAQKDTPSTAASERSSPAAAASPARRRPKAELPAIRCSPVKAAQAQGPAAPAASSAQLMATAPVQGAAAGGHSADAASVPSDDVLSRMQGALHDFVCAFQRLHAPQPAEAVQPSCSAAAVSQRYREAAGAAVAQLTALLAGHGPAPSALESRGPDAAAGPVSVAAFLRHGTADGKDEGPSAPAAVECMSPRVSSQDALQRRQVLHVDGGAPAPAASASVGSGLGSSQVVLEVGLMESMVEEKVQQRLKDELRRVEEAIMQRIMQSMRTQSQ